MTNTDMNQGSTKIVNLLPEDANNNPGVITGTPNIVSTDTSLVQVLGSSTDGLQGTLGAGTHPGTATLTAHGLDGATQPFQSTFVVTVNENSATHFDFSFV